MFSYRVFDLALRSELECPELTPGDGSEPDIVIRRAALPALPPAATPLRQFDAGPYRLLFGIENVGRVLVRDGREIVVDADPGVSDDEIRLYIFGSGLGALLHQRGVLPLHGSAVRLDAGAVVFAGPSGFGKSTLAAAFHRRGKTLVADDICAVTVDGGSLPQVAPGFPQQKLRSDSLAALGETSGHLRCIDAKEDKYAVPVRHAFAERPEPLQTVYILRLDDTAPPAVEPLSGSDKAGALLRETYRKLYLPGMGLRNRNFELALRAAASIRVCRLRRPHHPFLLDELIRLVEEDQHDQQQART
jgi:hypothetical protein